MQFSVSELVYIYIRKELLLTTGSVLSDYLGALSVGKVANAFGHANELQFDTRQFET